MREAGKILLMCMIYMLKMHDLLNHAFKSMHCMAIPWYSNSGCLICSVHSTGTAVLKRKCIHLSHTITLFQITIFLRRVQAGWVKNRGQTV